MIFEVCFYRFTIGSLTILMSSIDTKEKALAQKIIYINQFAEEAQLPNTMRKRLRKVIEYNATKTGSNIEKKKKKEVFQDLPLKLRCEVAMTMH